MKQLFTSTSQSLPIGLHGAAVLVLAAPLHWFMPNAGVEALKVWVGLPVLAQSVVLIVLLYVLMAFSMGTAPFVYFRF